MSQMKRSSKTCGTGCGDHARGKDSICRSVTTSLQGCQLNALANLGADWPMQVSD